MNIYYLYNSGFVIFTGETALVFDYYRDTPARGKTGLSGGVITTDELSKYKKVYVFSSHSHDDHFNPVILEWQNNHEDIKYILSEDIKVRLSNDEITSNITFMAKGESINFDDLYVKAYGSTDIGISFYIEIDGYNIFHAGDLNCWHWPNESSPAATKMAINSFEAELQPLIKEAKPLDVAFFPVDPRMKIDFDRGAIYFANMLKPKLFVPMHFRGCTEAPTEFSNKIQIRGVDIWTLSERGDNINFSGGAKNEV